MGIFGTSLEDLERKAKEVNAKANNLPYKLAELKKTNKAVYEEMHNGAVEIDKGVAEIIMDTSRSPGDIARASKCAEIAHGILKRLGY